jgi:hypothetical protein
MVGILRKSMADGEVRTADGEVRMADGEVRWPTERDRLTGPGRFGERLGSAWGGP